ncbi:MAG: hypothetical protein GEU86_21990 [Actinophytocola sp.]|nr:hypothetical protein [Actinophytocola sp.]
MKFMLLVHSEQADFDTRDNAPEGLEETFAFMARLNAELEASGELVDAAGLAGPDKAKTVRRQGSATVTTDGPFAEAKEVLGGYWVLECSEDRALEIATHVVDASGPQGPDSIEVRQIMG